MDNKNIRWQQRFENYKKALHTIETVVPRFAELSELEQDGLINRFQFTLILHGK